MFIYLLRSIKARWLENLAIVAVLAVVVATATLILSFADTMVRTAVSGGDPSKVLLLSRGATTLYGSSVGKEGYDWVRVRPQIAQRDDVPLVSPEVMTQAHLRTIGGLSLFVPVRGVDPVAYHVHDKVRIVKGRAPQPGTDEIVIGKRLDGVFPGFLVGGEWHKHPIVGVFEAGGSLLEHEFWIDRKRLAVELGRRTSDPMPFMFIRAKSPADAEALIAKIDGSKESLAALSEPTYLATFADTSRTLVRLAVAFSLLLALGAGIAAVNTLYSSLLGRMSEFAMLNAIGARRLRLAGLILQESMVLALIGITIGVGVAVALDGQQIARLWTEHPFEQLPLHVGPDSLLVGAVIGAVVGIAGGLLPGLSIFRMDLRKNLG